MQVLIVEDEVRLAEALAHIMKEEKYLVDTVHTGTDGLEYARSGLYDVVILDVMLPGLSGFEIIKRLRTEKIDTPVIMLTAKVADGDKIMGLTIGADDYITKPFNPLEVVARVKTQLRRYMRYNPSSPAPAAGNQEYDIRGLLINKENHKCYLFGQELQLTPIEFSILWYLCERQGAVVPSEELFEAVWGEKYLNNNNTVMAHIGRLREKMKEPARKPKFIKTVWGVGYTIEK